MTLGQMIQQAEQLKNIVQLLGEDPHDCVIKVHGEGGEVKKLIIEMPEQTIIREWTSWAQ